MNQERMDGLYMDVALRCAQMSYAKRRQVGAVVVRGPNIVSFGWNGTPTGHSNHCEDPETGMTLPHVIHAEANALAKMARQGIAADGATLYTTDAPCNECAKLIQSCGIREVVYRTPYRDQSGLELLASQGISIRNYVETHD